MKRGLIAVAALAGAMAAGAPALGAQKVEFGLGAGLTMPMGDYGDLGSLGFHGTGGVTFGLGTGPLSARVEVAYHRTGLEQDVDGNTSILGGMASLAYNVPSAGQVKPYLLAGIGYYQAKFDVTGFAEGDASELGFGGGAGLAFALTSASVFVELRYMTVGGDVDWNFLPITVGVRFGGK